MQQSSPRPSSRRCRSLFPATASRAASSTSPTSRSRRRGPSSPARPAISRLPRRPLSASECTRWRSRRTPCALPVSLALAAIVGFLFALVVGLSTLRLRGVYFVIFTFGLTELMRQLVSWYEINITNKVNRFLSVSIDAIIDLRDAARAGGGLRRRQLASQPHAARSRAARDRRRRDRGAPQRNRHHAGQGAGLRRRVIDDGAGRGSLRAALPEHRPDGRVQQQLVVHGTDRRPARGTGKVVGPRTRRRSAGSAFRFPGRQLFAEFHDRPGHLLRRDRLFHPGRHRSTARAALPMARPSAHQRTSEARGARAYCERSQGRSGLYTLRGRQAPIAASPAATAHHPVGPRARLARQRQPAPRHDAQRTGSSEERSAVSSLSATFPSMSRQAASLA